jgi:hypothetical protein
VGHTLRTLRGGDSSGQGSFRIATAAEIKGAQQAPNLNFEQLINAAQNLQQDSLIKFHPDQSPDDSHTLYFIVSTSIA